jgi:hypothetical protein
MPLSKSMRARWFIRLSLGALVALLVGTVLILIPRSSYLSPEEAKGRYKQLRDEMTRIEVEAVFGKPNSSHESNGNQRLAWRIIQESFTEMKWADIYVTISPSKGLVDRSYFSGTVGGWGFWKWRWAQWWSRLGLS